VTAGTVMHKTHMPLALWFWAAYLVSTHGPGISALQLRRQLGITRYETAWMVLHKLRRAMVAPEREPLTSEVEVAARPRSRSRTDHLPRDHPPCRKSPRGAKRISMSAAIGTPCVLDG